MVTKSKVVCTLCGLDTYHPIMGDKDEIFCCAACKEVASLLKEAPIEATPLKNLTDAESTTLGLGGLWCTSCAWLIEERLKRAPGVEDAQVSFIQRQAQITFDPQSTTPIKIKKKIRGLGYRARLEGEEEEDEEDRFFTRLLVGGMMAMHIMAISLIIYVRDWMGLSSFDTQWLEDFFYLMQFAVSIPLSLILGLPILRAGIASLLRGMANTHTLVTLGAFSALILSTRNLFLEVGHVYFDTAAMLFLLITIGRWLEMQAHKASNEAVDNLMDQIPPQAMRITNQGEELVNLEKLAPGDRIRVRPGEHFPVDGIVAQGEGDLDESLLTGESRPVTRTAGEMVLAGTINLDGIFEVIASSVGVETRAGQIGRLLHQALWQRSPVERLADKLAAWMIPVAIALAGGVFLFWHGKAGFETALLNSLSVLLIACPCALGLATPLTLWQALGKAARNGVILRSTAVIERLSQVQKVYFDKTGTLTQLPFRVKDIATNHIDENEFLAIICSLETFSEHPLGSAIAGEADRRNLELQTTTDFGALPGQGVTGKVNGKQVWVGSLNLMTTEGLLISPQLEQDANAWQDASQLVIYAGWNGKITGIISLDERIRPEAFEAIQQIKELGSEVEILTGDNQSAKDRWEKQLEIPVITGLSPEEKLEIIHANGENSIMVGDGINDGPALAAASVGIALHHGTDVAQAAAEVILVNDDLFAVPWLLDLAAEARKRIYQNLAWAFVYNIVGIGLAASGILQPVLAAVAMLASSFLVTRNALRLRRFPSLVEDEEIHHLPLNSTNLSPLEEPLQ